MKPIKYVAAVLLCAAVVAVAQVFPTTEVFRRSDSNSEVKAKLAQSGVTVAELSAIADASITSIKHGTFTLTNGAAIIAAPYVGGGSRIFLTKQSVTGAGATNGVIYVEGRTNSVNFTVRSTVATDGSAVAYLVLTP